MPVAFEELEGSPSLRIDEAGTVARRVFRVAWDDWPAFARELVGSYAAVAGSFVFTPPIEFPGMPNLVVAELAVEPFVADNPRGELVTSLVSGTNRYPDGGARVTATYRTAYDAGNLARSDMPSVPAGTYLTYAGELGAEQQVVPGRVWHYVDPPTNTPVPPDVYPALLVPTGNFRLAWHRVPMPPWDAIRDLRGKVNNATFLGSPAGTVLFLGARLTRNFQFNPASGFWTIEYAFAERAVALNAGRKVGWNYFYKEIAVSGEHWVQIADDSGYAPYRSGSFAGLFQFGAV